MRHASAGAVLCLALAACTKGPVASASRGEVLSAEQATHEAVVYLRGETYGNSLAELLAAIKDAQLLQGGSGDCGPVRTSVWAFHVESKYSGWLCLDAVTGTPLFSSLPFIRR